MDTTEPGATPNWRTEGVRVIPGDALDTNTPQTPGMTRAAAVTHDRTGSEKLWAGTATIHPGGGGQCGLQVRSAHGRFGDDHPPISSAAPNLERAPLPHHES